MAVSCPIFGNFLCGQFMSDRAISALAVCGQPEGWSFDQVLIDWLHLKQPNLGQYQPVNDGRVVRFDASGEVVFETAVSVDVPGSHDSSLRFRVTEQFLELSFNPSRWNRRENLFGCTYEQAIAVANEFLASRGLAPLGSGEVVQAGPVEWNESARRFSRPTLSTGFRLLRIDATLNVATGSPQNLAAYLRGLRRQTLPLRKTRTFEGTILYKQKASSVCVYDKAAEMRKHGAAGYRGRVADWCESVGLARVELRMQRPFLIRHNLREHVSHARIVDVLRKEVSKLPVACDEEVLDVLTREELASFLIWRGGFDIRSRCSTPTFYRHRKAIKEKVGYDIGAEAPIRFRSKEPVFSTEAAQPPGFYDMPEDWKR